MYIVDNAENFVSILLQEQALSDDQKSILRAEFINDPEGRGYANKTDAECLRLLCFSYTKEVTTPASQASNGYVDMGAIRVYLTEQTNAQGVPYVAILKMLKDSTDPQTKVLGIVAEETLNWEALNTGDPRVIANFQTLQAVGVLSEEVVNHILFTEIPESTIINSYPGRNIEIFGANIVPSLTEIGEARS